MGVFASFSTGLSLRVRVRRLTGTRHDPRARTPRSPRATRRGGTGASRGGTRRARSSSRTAGRGRGEWARTSRMGSYRAWRRASSWKSPREPKRHEAVRDRRERDRVEGLERFAGSRVDDPGPAKRAAKREARVRGGGGIRGKVREERIIVSGIRVLEARSSKRRPRSRSAARRDPRRPRRRTAARNTRRASRTAARRTSRFRNALRRERARRRSARISPDARCSRRSWLVTFVMTSFSNAAPRATSSWTPDPGAASYRYSRADAEKTSRRSATFETNPCPPRMGIVQPRASAQIAPACVSARTEP